MPLIFLPFAEAAGADGSPTASTTHPPQHTLPKSRTLGLPSEPVQVTSPLRIS